jgi:hypothetical protein
VGTHGEAEAPVVSAFRERFQREAGRDDVRSGPAVLLGDREAEEPEVSEGVPDIPVEAALDVALVGAWLDDASGEVLYGRIELELFAGVPEVQRISPRTTTRAG